MQKRKVGVKMADFYDTYMANVEARREIGEDEPSSNEPQRCWNCIHFATDDEVLGDGGLCGLRYQAKVFSTADELVDYLSESIMDNDSWCKDYELDEDKLA